MKPPRSLRHRIAFPRVALFTAATAAAALAASAGPFAAPAIAQGDRDPISGSRPKTPNDGLSGDEKADAQSVLTVFGKGAYEATIARGTAFEKRYPQGSELGQVLNVMGLAHLMAKRPAQAIGYFRRALDASGSSSFAQFVSFNLAAAQFEAGQVGDADRTLGQIEAGGLDKDNQIKFHTLRARVHQRLDRPTDAIRETYRVSKLLETPEARKALIGPLEKGLQAVTDPGSVEQIYDDFDDAPLADLALYRYAELLHRSGKTSAAEDAAKKLMSKFPTSVRYADAGELIQSIKNQAVVAPNTVGVLLPLSGKFAKMGTKSLQAIQLAFRVFNLSEPDSKTTLVIQDSGETPEQGVRAINELYNKYHVTAVLGPLSSRGIDQVARRAQELGLPMISLAQQPSAITGDFVFQAGMTPQLQAREIARHAIERLKIKRFAILHPRDRYGEQYAQAFWDAVESLGGEVTGYETYAPGETDFRQAVDKLSGLYYTGARAREVEELAKLREEKKITKRTRKTEAFFALKPVVDYDAVFIPDEPKVVGALLPTFAYRDVDHVRFLGTAAWNSPVLVQRAQNHAEGSLFPDAYLPDSSSPAVKKFVGRYKATFNQEPSGIEAIAFDAASVLEKALSGGDNLSRNEARARIADTKDFPGVTGRISYRDGQLSRTLAILTFKGGQVVEAKDAPLK